MSLGGRVPVPVALSGWRLARRASEFLGAPVPPHVLELMTRGRTADAGRIRSELDLANLRPTQDVLSDLFEWATVTPISAVAREVA